MRKLFNELKTYKGFYLLMVLLPVVSLLAAALIVQYGFYEKNNRYETHLNHGYASLEAEAYAEAITAFEEAYQIENTYDAALGLAKAWFGSGDTAKAVQVLSARAGLYESTEEIEALIEEYNISRGIYPTINIGGKEIETNLTTIVLDNITLTEEDKQALAGFTDVVTLSLANCGLTDIEFLKDCSKLMSLTLSGNPISDFTPLYNKPDLRTLYINDTEITDYAQLHKLTSLTTLNANGNWITLNERNALQVALQGCEIFAGINGYLIFDVTIGDATFRSDVKELDLRGRGIGDVTPLQQFSAVKKLDLSDNKITWITPMADMRTLTELNFSDNRITNIEALSKMTRLTVLNMENNKVTDLSALAGLKKLTELNMNGNPIYHGHDTLSKLTKLEKLSLQNAQIQDKHLSKLPMDSLIELDLRNNKQLSESAVRKLMEQYPNCTIHNDYVESKVKLGEKSFSPNESTVDASYSSVIDLSPAARLSDVTSLNLAGNGISDFSPLKKLTELTSLNLQATGLTDCSSLSTLTDLTELNLSGNAGLTDITPLVSCTKLTTLYLDETGVTDVSPLANLSNLTALHLDKCKLSDFTQLHALTGLKSLYIVDSGITYDELTALQQALPDCTVYAGDVPQPTPAPETSPEA